MTFILAYPPTDDAVRDYLLGAPSTELEKECKAYFRSFLCSLFTSAHQLAEQFWPEGSMTSYNIMAETFYDFFRDTTRRNGFYDGVIANVWSADVWASFITLHNGLEKRCFDWPAESCPLLISMDEVHVLYAHRPRDTEDYTLYSRMKSVFSEGVSLSFAALCTSTVNHISKLAPSKDVADSFRERDDELLLPAPITELPFDAYIIADPLRPGKATLETVGSLEFTAKFGRPL
jgi:hypothetical protein